jgi:dipeptide/tripeptide permease
MDKEVEGLVERHREASFQHGFAMGFGMAAVGVILGVAVFVVGKFLEWWT